MLRSLKPQTLKWIAFLAASAPLMWLILDTFGIAGGSLGANPVEALLHRAGWWGLMLLLVTLAVTPVRELTGMAALIQIRRLVGLYAFFYVVLHVLVYTILDQRMALGPILEDIVERPYITVGLAAFVLLIPLAVTSTNASRRRLKARWNQLHKLVYPIGVLGVWHYWWQVKQDITVPLILAAILCALLGYRYANWLKRRRRRAARAQHAS
ncbi:MAG: protein-methionine-sulfoxide reductase heme-binding subunit MsrQ [Pseudomonadota bacterium]